jgi:hypothetical protein
MIVSALGNEVFLVLVERLEELARLEAEGFPVGPQLAAVRWLLETRLKVHAQSSRQDQCMESLEPSGIWKQ